MDGTPQFCLSAVRFSALAHAYLRGQPIGILNSKATACKEVDRVVNRIGQGSLLRFNEKCEGMRPSA